jgi:hypothetical protein
MIHRRHERASVRLPMRAKALQTRNLDGRIPGVL